MALDFKPHEVEAIAKALLGDPNRSLSRKNDLRFGNHGSVSVRTDCGTFFDHETDTGGGMLDLIERTRGLKGRAAIDFLREHGVEVADDPPRANGGQPPQQRPPQPSERLTATYDYTDEMGALVYQVCRYESDQITKDGKREKRFAQRRPDASEPGGWSWKVKGLRPLPYRLPELQEAIAQGSMVFIAEGEKAVEALREMGVPATCNSGGAGKFPDALVEHFRGAHVVILPDDDPQPRDKVGGALRFHADGRPVLPGWDHACMVAGKLHGVAASVRVLELFKRQRKEDAYDWAQQGGTADALYDLVEREARAWPFEKPFVSKFGAIQWGDLDAPGPEHEWLIKGVLTRGERSMMVGPSQSGKSFVAVDMALSIARGVDYFGRKTLRGGVVYQAGEGGRGLKKRLRAYRDAHGVTGTLPFVLLPAVLDLYASDDHTNALIAEIKHWASTFDCPFELVVIDTLSAATPGANENASEDMSRVLARCARIANACNCHVMIVHHMNADGSKPRGHTSIFANLDNVIAVEKTEASIDGRPVRRCKITKQKDGEDGVEWRFTLKGVTLGFDSDGDRITSCVVEPLARDGAAGDAAGPGGAAFELKGDNRRTIFTALVEALRHNGKRAPPGCRAPDGAVVVDVGQWRDELRRRMPLLEDDSGDKRAERAKKALQRALDQFQNWRLIGCDSPWVWLTGKQVRGFNLYTLTAAGPPRDESAGALAEDVGAFL